MKSLECYLQPYKNRLIRFCNVFIKAFCDEYLCVFNKSDVEQIMKDSGRRRLPGVIFTNGVVFALFDVQSRGDVIHIVFDANAVEYSCRESGRLPFQYDGTISEVF